MTLALLGGRSIRQQPFPNTITTGEEEINAVVEVMRTGLLSGFVGSPSPQFHGGPTVQALERAWSERFQVPHSISCNSATSGLFMAVGAAQVGPGDEVIVSPYTMSATATCVLFYGGIPVFADIEPDCFCLDPESVRRRITPLTKAILTTDIHGQPSAMDELIAIAKAHRLVLITDCAQAPGALYKNRPAGTLGDIGVFSLNRHKNLQCGEGGIAVTSNDDLARRMELIRNHGENLAHLPEYGASNFVNTLGLNFRMTELEAAVAHEQLKKLTALNQYRIDLVGYLNEQLVKFPGLTVPTVRPGSTHVYYMHALKFDEAKAGFGRRQFTEAMQAEGVPWRGGYVRPLYLEATYQRQIAIGPSGFPFVGPHYRGQVSYAAGLCPVAERLFDRETVINALVYPPLSRADMDDIVSAVDKVYENRAALVGR